MSDEPPVRLHCFAHSGDGVSVFDGWPSATGPGVEAVPVRLPTGARGSRPPLTTYQDFLAEVLPRFTPSQPGPYALYGHGLGALAALTVARALQETGAPPPVLLAVGACPPPVPARWAPAVKGGDADLLRLLGEGTAIPPASDEGVFLRAMLPVLRADLQLAHSLHEAARTPAARSTLTSALLVVASRDNPLAPPAAGAGWEQFTRGPVHLRTVPGHHFFVRGGRALPRLLGRACRVARRLAGQPAPVGG